MSFRLLHLQLFRAVFVNWHSNSGLTDGNWKLPGWAMYKRGAVGQGSENMPCFCSSLSPFRLALLRKRAQHCISVVVRLKRCVEVDFRSLTVCVCSHVLECVCGKHFCVDTMGTAALQLCVSETVELLCVCVYVFFFFLWSELQHIEMHMNLPAWAWLCAFSVFGLYCFLFVCLYVSICKSWSSSPVLSLLVLPLLLLWLPNFSQLHQVVNSSCDHSFTLGFLFPGKTILCISFLQKQNRCSCRHNCICF